MINGIHQPNDCFVCMNFYYIKEIFCLQKYIVRIPFDSLLLTFWLLRILNNNNNTCTWYYRLINHSSSQHEFIHLSSIHIEKLFRRQKSYFDCATFKNDKRHGRNMKISYALSSVAAWWFIYQNQNFQIKQWIFTQNFCSCLIHCADIYPPDIYPRKKNTPEKLQKSVNFINSLFIL